MSVGLLERATGSPDTNDLRLAVERALAAYTGRNRRIERLTRRVSPYRASCGLEELNVHLEGGDLVYVLFKDLSFEALSEAARRIKPTFLRNPNRELTAYKRALAGIALGTPECYGSVADEETGRYWLFLEHVAGRELYQVGELEIWRDVARWLALLHGRFTHAAPVADPEHLISHDETFYRLWYGRALTFLRVDGRDRTEDGRHAIAWLSDAYDQMIERLLALPSTFIHGEFYASNVLVQTGDELRVCPVDWEMAAVGPGLTDLAALTAGHWTDDERHAIALAYYETFPWSGNGGRPALGDFMTTLDCCRVQTALQWLGWCPHWTPPLEHRNDWLGEVVRVIRTLRI